MTAPVWMALPPEVHSALLSSGPGPGSLVAAAAAWNSLSTEYTEVADELSALVAAVQAGDWQGPSAESYVAANIPYVAWLLQNGANSTAMAAQQMTAATAHTAALAAMPTLVELAANHATHAVLLATNFFGLNTIPIALNEADYVRMWVQAATTMSTYQVVSSAAVAAAPPSTPAPQIVKPGAEFNPFTHGYPTPFQKAELQFVEKLLAKYLGYTHTGKLPAPKNPFTVQYPDVSNSQAWADIMANYHTYVVNGGHLTAGKPLSYDLGNALFFINYTFVDLLPGDLGEILHANLSEFFSVETLNIAFSFISMRISNVLEIINVGVNSPQLALAALPVLAAPAGGLSGLAGFAGLAGLAQQAAAMTPTVVPAATAPPIAIAPVLTPSAPVPTAAAVPASAPLPTVAAAVPPPPPPGGAAPPPVFTGPEAFGYLVGSLDLGTQARTRTKTREPISRSASTMPAAAAVSRPSAPALRRRRRATVKQIGRGYEYMDLDQDLDMAAERLVSAASDRGAATLGFAGTAHKETRAAGLTTMPGDAFGGGPSAPMLPGTWPPDAAESDRPAE